MQLIPLRLSPSHALLGELDANLAEVDALMRLLGVGTYWIAGGYLRDREAGIKPKDIDVFLPGGEPLEEAQGIRYDLAHTCVIHLGGVEVNFIRLNHRHTLETVLGRMDIGICQIGRDQSGTIVATQAYIDDVRNKTLTILEPPRTEHDTDHIRRVRAKFPDHRVIYCA
ncbi:hypothetical protein [Sinorhizobium meliloti]|uniref:hypothetical protein n=1 Tax=Rhizobium meliloti TaxID=382 RepID=UPI000FD75AE9|nr:hypothetical protein [Sinorhizobium meliloti]RVL01915.1 hypothetical protein CN152_10810 [Sinorhizobium meliloti]RVM26761.1 hypothetical protein CN129_28775 [Sinorhizobium meliloti]RVN42844.1 hypothetical protein CN113_22975 [Sinorhizobium meliloti]